jgi:hypothetical protein
MVSCFCWLRELELINRCQTSRTLLTALDEQITYLRQQNANDTDERKQYEAARNTAFLKATDKDPKKGKIEGSFENGAFQPAPAYEGRSLGYADTGRL